MRKRKLIFNTSTSLLNQIITIICGFILPKLFLEYYGSTVNGLVSSITQFLGFITFLELGVGAVVQSALYKPLANNDNKQISKILKSADNFFKKIAYILLIYTVGLAIIYPLIVNKEFNYIYTLSLIIIISISSFAQYYFGIKYQLLLNADQKSYIQMCTQIITMVLNTVCCIVLIKKGCTIQSVKLLTALIFVLRPILLSLYVKKNYKIDNKIIISDEPIKQKWNGLAQHLAAVVLSNTDIVVLTIFSTLDNVSIYTVYNLVVTGVKQILTSITTGASALFGNMLSKKEDELLIKSFEKFEIIIHYLVVILFTCTAILIVPFVKIYTKNITDINYILPQFAILITMAQAAYCLRLPYNIMVLAAGHYKQTQKSAIIEMLINILISIGCVLRFDLIGVALGTLIAMSYRTIYLVLYLSKNIIHRSTRFFIKHIILDLIIIMFIINITSHLNYNIVSYYEFIILAFKVGIIAVVITTAINIIGYYKIMLPISKRISLSISRTSKKNKIFR